MIYFSYDPKCFEHMYEREHILINKTNYSYQVNYL